MNAVSCFLSSADRLPTSFLRMAMISSGTAVSPRAFQRRSSLFPSIVETAANTRVSSLISTAKIRPGITGNVRSKLASSPIFRGVARNTRYTLAVPSAPPTKISSRPGSGTTAESPPRRAPGVIEVMLSINRSVAVSVNLQVMSRATDTMWVPSAINAVPSTQSSCAP